MFTLAAASGNTFAYAWDRLPDGADGPGWAQALGRSHQLDGLFLVRPPIAGRPWLLEHWDADGASTFCSNGTRAALALQGAPAGDRILVVSNQQPVTLRRDAGEVAILMPGGLGAGFRALPPAMAEDVHDPHAFGWVGNPQLVLERADVDRLDLAALAVPLRHHPALPGGTNVNVLQVLAPGHARIRSWERGVEGETRCCGTGCAMAGAWLARRTGLDTWRLQPQGDPVTVTVELEGDAWRELWLSGPVQMLGTIRV